MNDFIELLAQKSVKVGVIGLGYVGIPLALRVADAGLPVIGFDIAAQRVDQLNDGRSPLSHISRDSIKKMRSAGFEATCDFRRVSECNALVICVPTPLNKHREPDLGHVVATMESISPYMRRGQLLSLESTTWPGTTEEVLMPFIENQGLKIGSDVHLVYSPEREDPGNKDYSTRNIPKIVGGYTQKCLDAGLALYGTFVDHVIPVSSTKTAEMVKLLENIHRSVNIGLANEMKIVADRMGIDIFEVIDAAASKPFGFTAYYPGPGIGGHCIPIDPFYLTWKARAFGLHTRFIELAGEINASMPEYVMEKTVAALNERGKALKAAKVLVMGIAYKRDVDDMRESPSVEIMERLRDKGANVSYCDPYLPVFPVMREHKFDLSSVDLTPTILRDQDVVILLTDHDAFDYELVARESRLLIDTRGRFPATLPNLVRA